MKPTCAGIDFGTSNSTVGVVKDGKPQLIALEDGHKTIPSAVFFNFEDDSTRYGRRAILDYTGNAEGRLLRALKSVLGSSLVQEKTRIKTRLIPFTDIVGSFIAYLKTSLDQEAGQEITSVVLGRPVQFVDDDPIADARAQSELEKAARNQGFRNIAFQFEPIAAALDYEQTVRGEELALIVDMGGGTSDFSIVRVSPERAKAADRKDDILANTGVHIGGTDFDRLLSMANVMPELGYLTQTKDGKRNLPAGYFFDFSTWHRINMLYSSKAMADLKAIRYDAARPDLVSRFIEIVEDRYGHALATKVEQAKIELTDAPTATMTVELERENLSLPFTGDRLDTAIRPAVDRVMHTLESTLRDAQLQPSQITTLFLTGGSTIIPLVRRSVATMFPEATLVEGDMFGSVGLGLTLDAKRKFA
ncbi:MAG: Hsp70 family protein [Phyllobacterium sp.]